MAQVRIATPVGIVIRDDAIMTVSGTTAETTVMSYTIPAQTLNMINRCKFFFIFTLSTAAVLPGSLTIRVKYNGATLTLSTAALTLLASASAAPFIVTGRLVNKVASNSQFLYAELRNGSTGLALSNPVSTTFTRPTVDSTQDQVFSITAQFSNGSASNSLTLEDSELDFS